jgi:competence protein ComGC
MSRLIRSHRARESRGERGVSLVEIAVVCLILSIFIPLIFGVLTSVQKQEVNVSSRDFASGEAQAISDVLSRQIHAATVPTGQAAALTIAQANVLQFYSALGYINGPTQIKLYTTLSCTTCTTYTLYETVTQPGASVGNGPVYTGGTATVTTRVVGAGLVLPTPSPTNGCPPGSGSFTPGIFEYFNSPTTGGSCLTLNTSASPPALTSTQLGQVEHLTVTITTVDPSRANTTPTTTYTLQITLPNVDYYNGT